MSKEKREKYEKFIREHEPYSKDDPQYGIFDGVWLPDYDKDRQYATYLKEMLERYDKEQEEERKKLKEKKPKLTKKQKQAQEQNSLPYTITEEDREEYEQFIREHKPYTEEDPEYELLGEDWFTDYDLDRYEATHLKEMLDEWDKAEQRKLKKKR